MLSANKFVKNTLVTDRIIWGSNFTGTFIDGFAHLWASPYAFRFPKIYQKDGIRLNLTKDKFIEIRDKSCIPLMFEDFINV